MLNTKAGFDVFRFVSKKIFKNTATGRKIQSLSELSDNYDFTFRNDIYLHVSTAIYIYEMDRYSYKQQIQKEKHNVCIERLLWRSLYR